MVDQKLKDIVRFTATGRRKSAIARVEMRSGDGKILVNNKPADDYFRIESQRITIRRPLIATGMLDKFDIRAKLIGGGISGQADAISLGVARALLKVDEKLRTVLKREGFLTRDARVKERKKYGRKRARRRFQYSKR